MNSNESAQGQILGADGTFVAENVREIFPGAIRNRPVVNTRIRPVATGRHVAHRSLEAGMATAEYAIATLAAVGFAGLLVVILKSDEVRGFLLNIIRAALSF